MKRIAVLALALAVLSMSLVLATPKTAAACYCVPTVHQTAADWAKGVTCTDAKNKLYLKLVAVVPCETCFSQVVYTTSCYMAADGKWKIDGYMQYQCLLNCDPNP